MNKDKNLVRIKNYDIIYDIKNSRKSILNITALEYMKANYETAKLMILYFLFQI